MLRTMAVFSINTGLVTGVVSLVVAIVVSPCCSTIVFRAIDVNASQFAFSGFSWIVMFGGVVRFCSTIECTKID